MSNNDSKSHCITVYQVLSGRKFSEEDSYEKGCLPDTGSIVILDHFNNSMFDSLLEAIECINSHYYCSEDVSEWEYSTLNCVDEYELELHCSVLEDESGLIVHADTAKWDDWKNGKIKCWDSLYTFRVQKLELKKMPFSSTDMGTIKCSD